MKTEKEIKHLKGFCEIAGDTQIIHILEYVLKNLDSVTLLINQIEDSINSKERLRIGHELIYIKDLPRVKNVLEWIMEE